MFVTEECILLQIHNAGLSLPMAGGLDEVNFNGPFQAKHPIISCYSELNILWSLVKLCLDVSCRQTFISICIAMMLVTVQFMNIISECVQ